MTIINIMSTIIEYYHRYDDCHDYHEYDDYDNYDDYGDCDGDVIANVASMEYRERDVILSDVVPPQTDPDGSSAEHGTVGPRPSLPCARAVPAADCPRAPLRDTADCSSADVAPATYLDLANRSPAGFAPTTLLNSANPSPASVFNRQCLPGFAHHPSDLIASARLLSARRGFSISLVQPLSHPSSSDPGELITEGSLIVVSAPALSPGVHWCAVDADRWTRDI